jgi:copper(I)-binding protein
MKKILVACSAILFSAAVCAADTNSLASDDITVKTPDTAVVITDSTLAQVFMELDNNGTKSHTLIAATSPVAKEVELHETTHKHGKKAGMEQIKDIVIKPHSDEELKMGGFHVMLMGLKQPLKPGDNVPITLIFSDGSSLQVVAPVQ